MTAPPTTEVPLGTVADAGSGPALPRPGRAAWVAGGTLFLVLIWWLVSVFAFRDTGSVPTPWATLVQFVGDLGDATYWKAIGVTCWSALQGYLWGNLLALLLSGLVLVVPVLEQATTQFAVIASCIPLTAIAPLIVLMSDTGSRTTSVVLAGMSVFYTTVVGTLAGLKSSDRTTLDLVAAYGGGRWTQLRKVRLMYALPSVLSALRIAAPAALVGAILGELFLSGVDSGLGIMLQAAQIHYGPRPLWALAMICAAVAGLAYGAMTLLARVVAPWGVPR
ncbi:ABC transporter permease [Cryptosporangium phraense]|uniref:ABC transporter permease subunit n=1 Tax=Cryptosporangium phraense TaxID=2593070 RepID=A0A545AFT0_9ACTN|nr:ABC transporter permease subunit [Cryptosporangium phraense]TQS40183.1 ABC transporter permease subunit [Cryptosporangium phraense]